MVNLAEKTRMQTSVHGTPHNGFTLLELLLVLVILGVSLGILMPQFSVGSKSDVRQSARIIAATIRYLADQPSKPGIQTLVVINPNTNQLSIVDQHASGERTTPTDPLLSRPLLAKGVRILSLELERQGIQQDKEVCIAVGRTNGFEGWTLTLTDRTNSLRLAIQVPGGYGNANISEEQITRTP